MIKGVAALIAPVLTWIFKFSLRTSDFPRSWKFAVVTPIPKKGDFHDIKNYRPALGLNSVAKVFERVVHMHLYRRLWAAIALVSMVL